MAIMSNSGRGMRSVNSTVKRLIRVKTWRSDRSTLAMSRWGIASSHWTSGRHRVMW